MKYRLIYFEDSGKFYTNHEYVGDDFWHKALADVKILARRRLLPGLVSFHSPMDVVFDGDRVPHLILKERKET